MAGYNTVRHLYFIEKSNASFEQKYIFMRTLFFLITINRTKPEEKLLILTKCRRQTCLTTDSDNLMQFFIGLYYCCLLYQKEKKKKKRI